MSNNLGFSSRERLVGEFAPKGNSIDLEYSKKLLSSIAIAIPKVIDYKLSGGNSEKFENIYIDIKYLNYQKILKDRKNAIANDLLKDSKYVDAIITNKGKKYKAKIRLKGDTNTHWRSRYRMSLRVKLKEGKTLFGNSRFSIQKPAERAYPYDPIFQSTLRNAGNLSPGYKFAHVYVNGSDWGIMALEEHMSKEFLEKQQRKKSIIVRFSNEDRWLYKKKSGRPYTGYRISEPALYVNLYGDNDHLKQEKYRRMYSYILNQHLNLNPSLYDVDSFTKAYLLTSAWHWHALNNSNTRYYFNPYTLKLEIIATDQVRFGSIKVPKSQGKKYPNNIYHKITSSKSYLDSLSKNTLVMSNAVENLQEKFNNAHLLFPVNRSIDAKNIIVNMNIISNNDSEYLRQPHDSVASVRRDLIEYLPTKQQASYFMDHMHIRHYTDGTMEFYNLIPDDVTIKNIIFNGKSIINNEIVVPSYLSDPEPTVIKTSYIGIQDDMFTINTKYQGFDRFTKNGITLVLDGIENPLLLNTVHEFDFINKLDDKVYEIKDGKWIVDKPIIVEGDLHISPGTNLQFSKDAYIIVKGALTAIGGVDNPITLKAISDSWKGIYVLNSSKKSHMKNVNISNISALEDELLKLTGGITFYKSNVDFDNIRINDVKAEDAINIVESSFSLNSVFINNTVSDGLDSDFSKGDIMDSEFSHIGGDALDFSGSNVSIRRTQATNVKDKAVSAGEKSILNIKDSNFDTIGVGVASKDGSSVTITDTKISNYKLYAAMSYLKKDFYDMPSINLNNCLVSEGNAYIRQKGTSMIVDNHNIPESEVSVKKLYKTRVMMK
jgi:hypothetical protein